MKKISYLLAALVFSILACKKEKSVATKRSLQKGFWKASLEVQDQKELPFLFEVTENQILKIYNAEEVIEVDEITIKEDSIYINFPVFEGYLAAKMLDSNRLSGSFIKKSVSRVVPFSAVFGKKDRFTLDSKANYDISGNWETIFSPDNPEDRYIAKGVFKQNGNSVTGTFRTTTGDYRYLEGGISRDSLKLSTFDGAHAFLFTAKITDSSMNGHFYSGNHWKEPFIATRNEVYELPSEDSLTTLKNKDEKFAFSFPNAKGKMISLSDEDFKEKVVVVQIMGTWCPNCMDETKYYVDFYERYKDKNVEIVSLAFEYAKTREKAFVAINRLRKKLKVPYPILLAQYGSANKEKAQEKLPMLEHVLSYPTTIFIDKKGNVRKIHTGFNGPATGQKYIDFKMDFERFVDQLLSEQI